METKLSNPIDRTYKSEMGSLYLAHRQEQYSGARAGEGISASDSLLATVNPVKPDGRTE